MNKTLLIARHEFLAILKRKFFLFMTLGIPLLGFLGIVIFQLVQGGLGPSDPDEIINTGYVDQAGGFGGFADQPGVRLVPFTSEELANGSLVAGEIDHYFVIPADYVATGEITLYTLERGLEPPQSVVGAVRNFLLQNLLAEQVPQQLVQRAENPLNLTSVRLDETGAVAADQGGFGAFIVPYIFAILLMISIFSSSGYLLESLGEEKENRVMEILLSSISPRQLLTGKVLGLGAAGLVQIAVWVGSIGLLGGAAAFAIGSLLDMIQIPGNFYLLAIIYFILGYLVFAVLMASIGAISPTIREGQQISALFTLIGVSPLWFAVIIIQNPEQALSQFLTYFPLTAPVTVMMRLALVDIPAWQIVISVIILLISIIGGLLLAARTFRVFLLMYGKRPGWRTIIRSIRSA